MKVSRAFSFTAAIKEETESRHHLLDLESYFMIYIVQNCWFMMLIKSRLIVSKFYCCKFSTDNAPPYCLHWSGPLPLISPLNATACLMLGQDYNPRLMSYFKITWRRGSTCIFCIIQENPREIHTEQPSMTNNIRYGIL